MPYVDREAQRRSSRKHYLAHSDAMKERAAVHREQARERNRQYVAAAKTDKPCADCGVVYPPFVMQFDHLGEDKDRAIATMAGRPSALRDSEPRSPSARWCAPTAMRSARTSDASAL